MKNSIRNTRKNKIIKEIKEAIKTSLPYLLSHHEAKDYNRCHLIKIAGKQIHICARCLGIYLGLIISLFFNISSMPQAYILFYLAVAPISTLVDQLVNLKIKNIERTITGLLLGTAFIIGIKDLAINKDYWVLLIGGIYAVLALLILKIKHNPSRHFDKSA